MRFFGELSVEIGGISFLGGVVGEVVMSMWSESAREVMFPQPGEEQEEGRGGLRRDLSCREQHRKRQNRREKRAEEYTM